MNNRLFFVLVTICLITHLIRSSYEILKHKKILKSNRFTFIIIFINMVILWASWFGLCSMDMFRINLPNIMHYFGVILILSGVILFLTALFTIKTLEDYDGDLITKGIYSRIRHPMYLGFICWCIGAPVYYTGIFSIILSVPFIGNILFWRNLEEQELEKKFLEYKFYRVKTFF